MLGHCCITECTLRPLDYQHHGSQLYRSCLSLEVPLCSLWSPRPHSHFHNLGFKTETEDYRWAGPLLGYILLPRSYLVFFMPPAPPSRPAPARPHPLLDVDIMSSDATVTVPRIVSLFPKPMLHGDQSIPPKCLTYHHPCSSASPV